jgi:hypothetical protein
VSAGAEVSVALSAILALSAVSSGAPVSGSFLTGDAQPARTSTRTAVRTGERGRLARATVGSDVVVTWVSTLEHSLS